MLSPVSRIAQHRPHRGAFPAQDLLAGRYAPLVEQARDSADAHPRDNVVQALRGMALVVTATLVAELGDITHFADPRELMAYLGLVLSERTPAAARGARAV
jgi:transposase